MYPINFGSSHENKGAEPPNLNLDKLSLIPSEYNATRPLAVLFRPFAVLYGKSTTRLITEAVTIDEVPDERKNGMELC